MASDIMAKGYSYLKPLHGLLFSISSKGSFIRSTFDRWLVIEQHLRNAVSDSFRMLFSFINRFDRVLGIVVNNLEIKQSSVICL